MHANPTGMKGRNASAIAIIIMSWAGAVPAHTITVDGDPSDWVMTPPASSNTGAIGRSLSLAGEYVWLDAGADERTDFASPDTRVDIREVRITADATRLHVLVLMTDIDLASGNGAPQVQVAIDRDGVPSSGAVWFAVMSDTQVAPGAAWEYLAVTHFGSGRPAAVYDTSWLDVSGGAAASSCSATNEAIEISLPWSVIGGAPAAPLHFTIVSLRGNDTTDEAWDIGGGSVSDVLDAVTNYGNPGATSNTFAEVSDAVLNYSFEVWFHLDPDLDPSPPLVVNEVLYDPTVTEPANEWVEIFNRTGVSGFPIQGFKVGDEETVDGTEGMEAFPPGATVALDYVVVVANDGTEFLANNLFDADFEMSASSGSVPDMANYSLWASGSVTLSNTADEIILLDPHDTVVDAVTYDGGLYPGVADHPGVGAGHSIERPQAQGDSNDCSEDMIDRATPTPGSVTWRGSLGTTCAHDIECVSGFCVGSACCDSACTGTCDEACDTSGHCLPVVCPAPTGSCQISTCDPTTGCSAATGVECTDTAPDDCNDAACDGAGACDQAQGPEDTGYVCRPIADICDVDETCTGSAGACPSDAFVLSTVECRASLGDCDAAEMCTGTSAPCPADAYEPSTVECRASTDLCDAAESCTGSSVDCPADELEPSTTVCRPEAGSCDVEETCTGTTAACPTDEILPDDSTCDDTDPCTEDDICTSGACAGSDKDCSLLDDQCNAGACNATTGDCEAVPVANDTECDDSDPCTDGDTCQDGTCTAGANICADEEPEPPADAASDTEEDTGPEPDTGREGCSCLIAS